MEEPRHFASSPFRKQPIAERFGYQSVLLALLAQLQSIAKHRAADFLAAQRGYYGSTAADLA